MHPFNWCGSLYTTGCEPVKYELCGEWCKVTCSCGARKQKEIFSVMAVDQATSCCLRQSVYTASILFLAVK